MVADVVVVAAFFSAVAWKPSAVFIIEFVGFSDHNIEH